MEQVLAPMAGSILGLECRPGEAVAADDVVVLMEAMKMEAEVYAPVAGTVTAVKVVPGQSVEEGDVLLEID